MSTRAVDYTLKPDSVSVVIYGPDGVPEPYVLNSTHQTFNSLVRALKRKEWKRVPKLISLAAHLADKFEGSVEVRGDGIYYKGVKIDNSLTQRIQQIIKEGKTVQNMLRFMDNLYQNPQPFAITELYDWLNACKLPITDDGRFTAYKGVRYDFKDCRTGTIDNSPGQIVFMKRSDVDTNRHETCSVGLHFCSAAYLPTFGGDRVVKVVIDPKDVVSIPTDYGFTKGRTWKYEVVAEVSADQIRGLMDGEDIDDYRGSIFSLAKDHKKLYHSALELPAVKRLIRRGKQTQENIRKMAYGRLAKFFTKFTPPAVDLSGATNPFTKIRTHYGVTRGQVAQAMGVTYREVYNLESTTKPILQKDSDAFIAAVMKLVDLGSSKETALSIKKG